MSTTSQIVLSFIDVSLKNLTAKVTGNVKKYKCDYTIETFYDAEGNEFNPGKSLKHKVKKHLKKKPSLVFPKGTEEYKQALSFQDDENDGLYNMGGSSRGEGF
jgi:hypothetical protein